MPELSDALLFQVGIGPAFETMLEVSRERHTVYCQRHGFDFWRWTAAPQPVPPMWQRYFGVLKAFDLGYKFVVHLDADCLIANMDVDLRSATDAPLGMRRGQAPGGEPVNFNGGVMFARPGSRGFFAEMVRRAPAEDVKQDGPWWQLPDGEARIMNEMLASPAWRSCVQTLDCRWNCVQGLDDYAQPCIVAWHGIPDVAKRIANMRAWLLHHA